MAKHSTRLVASTWLESWWTSSSLLRCCGLQVVVSHGEPFERNPFLRPLLKNPDWGLWCVRAWGENSQRTTDEKLWIFTERYRKENYRIIISYYFQKINFGQLWIFTARYLCHSIPVQLHEMRPRVLPWYGDSSSGRGGWSSVKMNSFIDLGQSVFETTTPDSPDHTFCQNSRNHPVDLQMHCQQLTVGV